MDTNAHQHETDVEGNHIGRGGETVASSEHLKHDVEGQEGKAKGQWKREPCMMLPIVNAGRGRF